MHSKEEYKDMVKSSAITACYSVVLKFQISKRNSCKNAVSAVALGVFQSKTAV